MTDQGCDTAHARESSELWMGGRMHVHRHADSPVYGMDKTCPLHASSEMGF